VFRAALLLGILMPLHYSAAEEPPLRDPMRPYEQAQIPDARGNQPRRIALTAVLISAERRIAVINGKFYREGESVDGAQITRIESESVRFRRAGQDIEVRLDGGRTGSQQTIQGDSAS
jgi:MSHA biogenesis protein MshK